MKELIPAAALSQHIAVLGKTGSGKSYAAKSVIVEPLLAAGRRVCVVDPTAAWWGLRSSSNGKGKGFSVLVMGGDHGDIPLTPNSGEAVARLVCGAYEPDKDGALLSVVLDTSLFTVGERTRWYIAFAGSLYRLNRGPLYLVLDEAHNFAPKGSIPDPDVGRMLHATNTIASGGRSRGIRLTMITQRPQKLHNDTLSSADTLVAMRVLAPHDRGAVEDWVKACGDPQAGKVVLNSLASLQKGEGWVWYPEGAYLERVKFPKIKTFDSSATPEDGEPLAAPESPPVLNIDALRMLMMDAIQEAEANDPKLLRKRIAELERDVKASIGVASPADINKAGREGYANGREAGFEAGFHDCIRRATTLAGDAAKWLSGQLMKQRPLDGTEVDAELPVEGQTNVKRHSLPPPPPPRAPRVARTAPADGTLTKAARSLLIALAQHHPEPLDQDRLAILAGYAVGTGHLNNTIGSLRAAGYMTKGWPAEITPAGLDALGNDYEPLPKGKALLDWWCAKLSKAEKLILRAAAEVHPGALTKAQLANRAGYEADTGHFNNSLGRLRTMQLLKGRGEIRASDSLF